MYFKIKYISSGRYSSTIVGKIRSWENGKVEILDESKMFHTLRESSIIHLTAKKKPSIVIEDHPIPEQMTIDQFI